MLLDARFRTELCLLIVAFLYELAVAELRLALRERKNRELRSARYSPDFAHRKEHCVPH